ncbi:unnamed protein product [Cuscuta epithymum]|uniref:Calmodulin n=1 Tax=Cuscuta epithymum TaxID=186058 RepID=A0AAV0GBQ4_9ASTE|nr:unnamed protein product [Cuscuta epithymum]
MAGQGPNMEQFEAYFQRADLDRDGRISGAEAVSFLQGSNLPKQVLAQVWMHADQSHSGFLSRGEFYNALKLVTVAQSKRELTPDIVKAALFGPASAKIPAPQINVAAIPAPQSNFIGSARPAPAPARPAPAPATQLHSVGAATTSQSHSFGAAPAQHMRMVAPQMGALAPTASQNLGFRGQTPQSQQYLPSQGSHLMRPPLPVTSGVTFQPQHGAAAANFPKGGGAATSSPLTLHDAFAGVTSGPTTHTPDRGITQSSTLVASRSLDSLSTSASTAAKDPNGLVTHRDKNASDSMLGGESFSVSKNLHRQGSDPTFSATSALVSTTVGHVTQAPLSSGKADPFEALQSTFARPSTGSQPQSTQTTPKNSQQHSVQSILPPSSSVTPAGASSSTPEQPHASWPKMTRPGVQKYAKVFMEVDTDRDGRITGEQARNLFLSWRLPREVLKQVWDLADQDNDSMLSLREFCIALYLMERYREGRSIPSTLPNSVLLDETLISLAGPPSVSYGTAGWGQTPGMRPHQALPGPQPNLHTGLRPQMQNVTSQPHGPLDIDKQNGKPLSTQNSIPHQLSNGEEQNTLESKGEAEGDNKVEDKEKVILDSREKLEYYRTKMQDLVLYKSRCDNRLNEIMERALADKREAELLQKKYEEKYKQVAEVASKLTIEEASFRDIQERKLELQQAIMKMEQGGSADGILQVRADRIQSDLEELLKALMECCKKHGVDMKSVALIELPRGWQPGIPEISAVWDEEWDKFEDEGVMFDVALPASAKSASHQTESSPSPSYSPNSINAEAKSESHFSQGFSTFETESAYAHSEDESKSPQGSPAGERAFQSPSKELSDDHIGSFETDAETNRSFEDSALGNFDNNDDLDSVWGFSAKEDSDHDKHGESYFFGSGGFGESPVRSPAAAGSSAYGKNSPFAFDDSVPGSPLSRAGNSPRYSTGSGDPFESFSRFDSFRTNDHSSSPRGETLTRFDSMNSISVGDEHSRGFSYDDSDPFGSSGPFKVSATSQTPKKSSDNWSAF